MCYNSSVDINHLRLKQRGWAIARRTFKGTVCEKCSSPAKDRHHKDGNTSNNDESNIMVLCRKCHMLEDGRLTRFRTRKRLAKEPKPCAVCGKPSKPLRKGRCSTCSSYYRNRGTERPAIDGHLFKASAKITSALPCLRCERPAGRCSGTQVRGYCRSCYSSLRRSGYFQVEQGG